MVRPITFGGQATFPPQKISASATEATNPVSAAAIIAGISSRIPLTSDRFTPTSPQFGKASTTLTQPASQPTNPFLEKPTTSTRKPQKEAPMKKEESDAGGGAHSINVKRSGKRIDLWEQIKKILEQLRRNTQEITNLETQRSKTGSGRTSPALINAKSQQTALLSRLKELEKRHGTQMPDQIVTITVKSGGKKR